MHVETGSVYSSNRVHSGNEKYRFRESEKKERDQGSISPSFYEQLLRQEIYAYWRMAHSVQHNSWA